MRWTKCKVCRTPFLKQSIKHKVCSAECAILWNEKEKERQYKKSYLEQKIKLRSRSEWIKLAQAAFNQYIRERDKNLPCISCGRHHKGQYHAGHYLSTGARPELRFEEMNASKQCAPCNDHLSGNIALYRINLIKKIGLENVEWLESNHQPKKWTIGQLQEIIATYKAKTKELIKRGET